MFVSVFDKIISIGTLIGVFFTISKFSDGCDAALTAPTIVTILTVVEAVYDANIIHFEFNFGGALTQACAATVMRIVIELGAAIAAQSAMVVILLFNNWLQYWKCTIMADTTIQTAAPSCVAVRLTIVVGFLDTETARDDCSFICGAIVLPIVMVIILLFSEIISIGSALLCAAMAIQIGAPISEFYDGRDNVSAAPISYMQGEKLVCGSLNPQIRILQ